MVFSISDSEALALSGMSLKRFFARKLSEKSWVNPAYPRLGPMESPLERLVVRRAG
jgi:hypothetical protein